MLNIYARIRNLRWIPLGSTLKTIIIAVDHSTFEKRFDHRKLGEMGSRAYLPEDLLISETWGIHPADARVRGILLT